MNEREAAIVTAFTGKLIGEFSNAHKYIEEIMGRPIYTHEFASKELWEEIKDKAWPDFKELSELINKEGK